MENPNLEQQNQELKPTEGDGGEDLLSRVSSFVEDNNVPPPEEGSNDDNDANFDYKQLESIETPEQAKEWAQKAYKSMEKGTQAKFREIADLRKEIQEYMKGDNGQWTTEKVQGLLNDQNFVQAAQQLAGIENGMTNEEYSALSDNEKKEIQDLKSKINQLQQVNSQALKQQQDEQLRNRFKNYNPNAVDTLTKDLLEGKEQATREHLWKVIDYDSAMKRAYELGRKDEREGVSEKISSSTVEGSQAVSSESIKPEENEDSQKFWQRIVSKNLKKHSASRA